MIIFPKVYQFCHFSGTFPEDGNGKCRESNERCL